MNALHRGFVAMGILTAVAVGGAIVSGTAWADRGEDRGAGCACSERGGGWKERGHREHPLAKALGLSTEQKGQIQTIFRKHRDGIAPLRKEMMAERQELRKLILSENPDEAVLREQVKKIAATGGDLAVRRARMFQEMRTVLTPEQIQKFQDLQEKRGWRMNRGEERHSNGE